MSFMLVATELQSPSVELDLAGDKTQGCFTGLICPPSCVTEPAMSAAKAKPPDFLGVELFDTMAAQCISIPCLATTYLRSFLLQTALGLTLQQTYFDHTGVGAAWKQGLLEAQQHTSKACSKLSVSAGASCDGAVLIGLPTAIPAEVLDDMEQDATGSSLLARLRVLSDQFAQQRIFMNASNAAGIVCLQELPVPSGAVRCGESPVMPVKHLFHLPKNFEVQLTGFFDGFRGSCVDWKFPSGLSCSGRIERERSLARQVSPVQTPPA